MIRQSVCTFWRFIMPGYKSKREAASDKLKDNKPALSLCMHFYNGADALQFQFDRWKQINPSYYDKLDIVLVDDYSDQSYKFDAGELPARLFRVETDIEWNQAGCKNLLLKESVADWLLFFDNDMTTVAKNIEYLVDKLPSLDPKKYYIFEQAAPWGPQGYRNEEGELVWSKEEHLAYLPHINVFLIHRSALEAIGGFDEDFTGHYGYEDTYMHNQLDNAGIQRVLLSEVTFDLHGAFTTNLDRSMAVNYSLMVEKALQGFPMCKDPIRFKYNETVVMTFDALYTKLQHLFTDARHVRAEYDKADPTKSALGWNMAEFYSALFISANPLSILELGCQTGIGCQLWNLALPACRVVGIDVADYTPNTRAENLTAETHEILMHRRWEFIKGNALDEVFIKSVDEKFDIIVQDCWHAKTTIVETYNIFSNWFVKCNRAYVIEQILGEARAKELQRKIQQKHKDVIVTIYKTPHQYMLGEYTHVLLITKKDDEA